MGFRGDERGVTVQIGAVLLFGILIISMATYQTTVVPNENAQVEYQHSQRVQEDMQSFRSAVTLAGGSELTRSVPVRLGTQYPGRALFVNPPAPAGTLRTETSESGIEVRNAKALDEEAADYWTGDDTKAFSTRRLSYEPTYHAYQNAPTTVYENGVLYNEFSETNRILQSGQSIVDGRRISLVSVDGDLSRSQSGTHAVDVRPVSVSEQSVTVAGDGDAISVVVPSKLGPDVWRETLLADEYDDPSTPDDPEKYVAEINAAGPNAVELVFESDVEYDLRLARIGVGTDVAEQTPTYLTEVRGDGETVPENSERKLVVEVRDEFDNPVSGVEVTASVDGEGSVTPTAISEENGRAVFTYSAPDDVDGEQTDTITAEFGSSPGDKERVEFEIFVEDSNGSGGSKGNINPGEQGSVIQKNAITLKGKNNDWSDNNANVFNDVLVTLENTGDTQRTIQEIRLNFYYQDSQGNSDTAPPTEADFSPGNTILPLRGAFQDVDVSLGPSDPDSDSDEETLSFSFRKGDSYFVVEDGDFFVITVVFEDDHISTYFVAPMR